MKKRRRMLVLQGKEIKGECDRCGKRRILRYEFRDIIMNETYYFCSIKCLIEWFEIFSVIYQIRGGEI